MATEYLNVEIPNKGVVMSVSSMYLGLTAPPRSKKVRIRLSDYVDGNRTITLTTDEARSLIQALTSAIDISEGWD